MKLTPEGRLPVLESVGVGEPLVDTVNVPALPAVKVALIGALIDGGALTVSAAVAVSLSKPASTWPDPVAECEL